ncbi:MAG: response regulator transcription factor [Spirochaetia bacterium]|nr:response regulator transcription factor [Spirochaetia bacterium]
MRMGSRFPPVARPKGAYIGIVTGDSQYRRFLSRQVKRHPRVSSVTCPSSAALLQRQEVMGSLDLVIGDLRFPGAGPVDLVPRIHRMNPRAVICVISSSPNHHEVVACLRNGAHGYAHKDDIHSVEDFVTTLLSAGGIITPSVAMILAEHLQTQAPRSFEFTPREKQVLELLDLGIQAVSLPAIIGISENTVRGYIKGIYKKLNVKSVSELHATLRFSDYRP